jgi:hypothetical protein
VLLTLLADAGGSNFWYGQLGESVFDRYSAFHVLGAIWLTIALSCVVRRQADVAVLLVVSIFLWEIFESVVIANLGVERVGGGETLRNRFLGDTLCDTAGYVTYLAAAWTVRRWQRADASAPQGTPFAEVEEP